MKKPTKDQLIKELTNFNVSAELTINSIRNGRVLVSKLSKCEPSEMPEDDSEIKRIAERGIALTATLKKLL